MEQNIDKNDQFIDKLKLFFNDHKIKIIITISIILIISITFAVISIIQERKNISISEKFIEANIYLSSENREESKKIFVEIIKSKNKFYSILALNTILEKQLESDDKKIIKYFTMLERLSISPEQKDLLTLKKALFLIKISKEEEGRALLKKLSNSKSQFKKISDQILEN